MKYLIVIFLLFSLSFSNNLERTALKVVIDRQNNLMWQDDISVIKIKKNHKDAIIYCENLSNTGFTNWRIPTLKEFETIVDKKNQKNYINRAFRFNVPDGYWALRAHWRTFWFYADYMHFVSGTGYFDNREKEKYVRCVRDL